MPPTPLLISALHVVKDTHLGRVGAKIDFAWDADLSEGTCNEALAPFTRPEVGSAGQKLEVRLARALLDRASPIDLGPLRLG